MTTRAIPPAPASSGARKVFDEALRERAEQQRAQIEHMQQAATVHYSSEDPTPRDIAPGTSATWRNTASGTLRLWVNDAGRMHYIQFS